MIAALRGAIALGALACGAIAQAYPHFQLSSDVPTCHGCHVSPAGGGILTEFGRDQSEEVSGGGNGALLHGLVRLPVWLGIGGDARLAALANAVGRAEGVELAAFPMQADLQARAGTELLQAVASVGLRSVARQPQPQPGSAVELPRPFPLLSREHYLLVQPPGPAGLYVRAGRFFAPYGLRLADHTTYVRRQLGFDLEQEAYGLSGGAVNEEWEVHATLFARDPWTAGGPMELGGAALWEGRVGNTLAFGASGSVRRGRADLRALGGVHGKLWLERPRLMLLGEVDGGYQAFDAPGAPGRGQLIAYLGPSWTPVRGLWVSAAYEVFAEDLAVLGTLRQAATAWVSYLPVAHVEVMLSSRAQRIGRTWAYNALLQLHYWL